jgi:carbon-monoxide dehydrogenase large subunit
MATRLVVKQGIGTFGGRSQAVGGAALHMAGGKVKTKMAKFASAMLEANERSSCSRAAASSSRSAPASGKSFAEVAGFAYVPCRCRLVSSRA